MRMRVTLDTHKLDVLQTGAGKKVDAILDKAAHDVEAGWKENIILKHVIDTGAYLNSVHVEGEHKPFERVIADGVEYGIFNEYGTSRMPARPCAGPAVEAVKDSFFEAMAGVFKP